MLKVTLYYDFNQEYREGPDAFKIRVKDFPFEVTIKDNELLTPIIDLYERNKDSAFHAAALKAICQYSDSYII